jgi:4-hydroxythreonine-4-phosphate dehydrogenase
MLMSTSPVSSRPCIAITMGDPCGVGPEIIVKAFSSPGLFERCLPLVIGHPLPLQRSIGLLGSDLEIVSLSEISDLPACPRSGTVPVLAPAELTEDDIAYGRPTEATCRAVLQYIETAVELAASGLAHAVCTCPIHKAHLHRHGFPFPGHTEFIRHLTHTGDVVMMLAGPRLRVALVTIHHAIVDVPGLLTIDRISRTLQITAYALTTDFGLGSPRIAVAGLNPHAGEEGRFGSEEEVLIRPAVESFPKGACRVSGPFPPDTLFHRAYEGEFDAIVAMYHDQGLIPIKLVHFHEAVNVTLGLPIIRTSVDHGTAYDLAGTGRAHSGSLEAAIAMASAMAHNRLKVR